MKLKKRDKEEDDNNGLSSFYVGDPNSPEGCKLLEGTWDENERKCKLAGVKDGNKKEVRLKKVDEYVPSKSYENRYSQPQE